MDSKDRILDAALQMFLTKGYERTSLSDIVRESRFTKGAIYHYFSSKDEIFAAAMTRLFDEMQNWFENAFQGSSSMQEIVRSHFDAIGDMKGFLNDISQTEDIAEFNYYTLMLDAMVKLPDFRKVYSSRHKEYLKSFAELIESEQRKGLLRQDMDPFVLSFMIHAMLEGSFLYSIMDEDIDLENLGPGMFGLLWNMIVKEKHK